MDFLKKRIRKFQEKKLDEILSKIQFYQYMIKQAEHNRLDEITPDETIKIREEISYNEKMMEIWQKNEEKLRRQMREMED